MRPLPLLVLLQGVLLLVASGCSRGCVGSTSATAADGGTPGIPSAIAVASSPVAACECAGGTGSPLSFAPMAKAADPGVVTILSSVERETRSGRRRVVAEGLGTGFVYDKEGYVLTNNHVVEDATVVTVRFADKRSLEAKVVGADKHTDVAVVKVTSDKPFHALALGDSDAVDVGDWVVAIGNPFGLNHTVSAGILSGKGRTRGDVQGLDPSGYFNFLQTDAAINQGNSGGPLMNLRGEVVGINTAIRAQANNIGFAIPINMVKLLLPILVRDGKVTRSAIGVSVRAMDDAEAQRLGRPDRTGAWVVDVQPGGAADLAGIRPDDVIIGFDGKDIQDPDSLRWWASIAGVGKTAAVKVIRGSRTFDVRATLGELPSLPDTEPEQAPPPGHPRIPGRP